MEAVRKNEKPPTNSLRKKKGTLKSSSSRGLFFSLDPSLGELLQLIAQSFGLRFLEGRGEPVVFLPLVSSFAVLA